jgi:hypothetical protein
MSIGTTFFAVQPIEKAVFLFVQFVVIDIKIRLRIVMGVHIRELFQCQFTGDKNVIAFPALIDECRVGIAEDQVPAFKEELCICGGTNRAGQSCRKRNVGVSAIYVAYPPLRM